MKISLKLLLEHFTLSFSFSFFIIHLQEFHKILLGFDISLLAFLLQVIFI